ncbi:MULTISPECIES: SpoVG family protein [unclassified Lacrimispora]|uniref:SpoVG family protein n=1 Tax=unclassified Lacrimispora TaxID=2719232 RepID=UPI00376FB862
MTHAAVMMRRHGIFIKVKEKLKMKVTAKIVAHLSDECRLKAIATVCLNNEFLITGVRIVECEKGPCVFMPSRKTNAGDYRDICFPITPELHGQIKDTVLEVYHSQGGETVPAE